MRQCYATLDDLEREHRSKDEPPPSYLDVLNEIHKKVTTLPSRPRTEDTESGCCGAGVTSVSCWLLQCLLVAVGYAVQVGIQIAALVIGGLFYHEPCARQLCTWLLVWGSVSVSHYVIRVIAKCRSDDPVNRKDTWFEQLMSLFIGVWDIVGTVWFFRSPIAAIYACSPLVYYTCFVILGIFLVCVGLVVLILLIGLFACLVRCCANE